MQLNTKIILVYRLQYLSASCLKPQSFPAEPNIEFVSFEAQGDSE